MKYEESQLKKVQEIELEILEEIIRVCEKNSIVYFTVGGTTLGAIRHNGFIPWDDDIDIGMMRDDYERFLKIAPTELKEGYTLTHFFRDENVPTYFAKVRKDGTKFVEGYTKDIPMHQGVYVDIFPYDFVPDKISKRKRYNRRVTLWNQLYIAKTVKTLTFRPRKHDLIPKAIRRSLHLLMKPIPKSYLYKKTDEALRAYNTNTNCTMVSSRGFDVFLSNINDLLPPVSHQFETIEVMIPAKAESVLTQQYGDYMKLPPEAERYNHAPAILEL